MAIKLTRKSKGKWAIVACLLALAVCAAMLLNGWGDPRARKGYYEGKTDDEIRDDLSSQVDWYAMEISIASAMELAENDTHLEARIENVAANHCDQKVRMYLTEDPQDVLFESGALAPGEYLQFVDLVHALPVGRHAVTVEFQGYEQAPAIVSDEGQLLGHNRFGASCAAEVTIDVRPQATTQEEG
ncbi:MAG: hypothetical protein Q4B54_04140 [Coriobacteriales bacterium]|nr:hypothetical protein [Coriobacteriales bacterium]